MLLVSRKLRERVKLSSTPAYRLAMTAGYHPSTLSKLLNGAERVRPSDPRVIAIGQQLGMSPEECFADNATEAELA